LQNSSLCSWNRESDSNVRDTKPTPETMHLTRLCLSPDRYSQLRHRHCRFPCRCARNEGFEGWFVDSNSLYNPLFASETCISASMRLPETTGANKLKPYPCLRITTSSPWIKTVCYIKLLVVIFTAIRYQRSSYSQSLIIFRIFSQVWRSPAWKQSWQEQGSYWIRIILSDFYHWLMTWKISWIDAIDSSPRFYVLDALSYPSKH
jgi:hypothetical protein